MLYQTRKNLEQRVHELELENSRLNGIIEELRRAPGHVPPYYIPTPPPSPLSPVRWWESPFICQTGSKPRGDIL
jgi:hypothetical protein